LGLRAGLGSGGPNRQTQVRKDLGDHLRVLDHRQQAQPPTTAGPAHRSISEGGTRKNVDLEGPPQQPTPLISQAILWDPLQQ
jgi:hypothetical protein